MIDSDLLVPKPSPILLIHHRRKPSLRFLIDQYFFPFYSNAAVPIKPKAEEPSAESIVTRPRVSHAFSVNMSEPEPVPEVAVVPDANQTADLQPAFAPATDVEVPAEPSPVPQSVAPVAPVVLSVAPDAKPSVATTSVSVTRRPKSDQSKESRSIKRLSSSGEETPFCAQSRSFRALEHLLFQDDL